jgi:hypothetical protein
VYLDSLAFNPDKHTKPGNSKTVHRNKTPKKLAPDKFYKLDQYAKNTPSKYQTDIKTLANYLVLPAKNDLEKARLLYSWIATHIRYDNEAYNTNNYAEQSAEETLTSRKAVCEDYSSLFFSLGLEMGLEVEKVIGYAKGYGYKQGDKFNETDHAWNAVKIDDSWKLFDVTWGSGSGHSENGLLKSESHFNSYWFDVNPKELVFSHLPEDTRWQLIDSPLQLNQFETLPYPYHTFFRLGLDPNEIFEKARSGMINEFPATYSLDFPIKKSNFPLDKNLTRGKMYSLTIESIYLDKLVIIDGAEWIYFEKEKNIFKADFVPKSDKITILGKVNWFDSGFSSMIEYSTVTQDI